MLLYFSGDWDVHWGLTDLGFDPWPFVLLTCQSRLARCKPKASNGGALPQVASLAWDCGAVTTGRSAHISSATCWTKYGHELSTRNHLQSGGWTAIPQGP